jgi:hypothetical protein
MMSTTPAARYMYSKTVSRQIFTIAGWLIQNSSPVHRLVLTNHVRFAFWGAEEAGLHGSTFYARHKKDIAVHPLNFDLIGSPNFVRFVFEGDALGASGPNGSGTVEKVLLGYFASQGLEPEPTAFDGPSDYKAFIDAGVPAGSLFSGAEEVKTAEEAAIYGGRGRLRRVLPQGVRRHQQPHQDVARPARRRRGPRHAGFRPDHVGA